MFYNLKDPKDNFVNHPTRRLLNPAKTEIERISKSILDEINICFSKKLKFNERKNTTDVYHIRHKGLLPISKGNFIEKRYTVSCDDFEVKMEAHDGVYDEICELVSVFM